MASTVNIILTRDVFKLGKMGTITKVKPGFARNFLFPRFLAFPALPIHLRQLESQKKALRERYNSLRTHSEDIAKHLTFTGISIFANAGKNGKLFGSIGARDIQKTLADLNCHVSHRDIKLNQLVKTLGEYKADINMKGDIKISIVVSVLAKA